MFNGDTLRDAVISAANNITNNRKQVDDLNVFPVPDGDTGTNMSMTVNSAARELVKLKGETASKVADTVASAMLRGARGNSGVITSLLFRGFSKGLRGCEQVTAQSLSDAFKLGVEAAYKAVMKPTEGTILTVARVASEYAQKACESGADALAVFEAAMEGANVALADTPNLLPVLKKAGVVDAGGKGYIVILDGMYSVFKNSVIIECGDTSVSASAEQEETGSKNAAAEFDGEITFTYCTEFIVNRNSDKDPSELRAYLESIGDSVVAVESDDIIKVHVHTDHPGNAFEKGLEFGSLVNMKVENMRDQHEKQKHDAKNERTAPAQNIAGTESYTPVAPEKEIGFVSVSAGAGLEELFKELGVDTVVSGGQTMNPSTDDILKAVELTPAETVFVLPNNKNIIMAAEQVVAISTRKVIVLHTKTIPQGISAMLAFDPDASDDDNAINMQKAFGEVTTGQVTFAARDSDYEGFNIKQGELLALLNGKLSFVEKDIQKCVVKLAGKMIKNGSSVLTLIYGEDVDDEQAAALEAEITAKYGKKVDVTLINGGQPVYYYIISVE